MVLIMRPYSANELAKSFCWGKDFNLLRNSEAVTQPNFNEPARARMRPVPLHSQRSDGESHRVAD